MLMPNEGMGEEVSQTDRGCRGGNGADFRTGQELD